MIRRLLFLGLSLSVLFILVAASPSPPGTGSSGSTEPPKAAAPAFDQAKALADLGKTIAGHENDPAESVFKNIKMFTGMPAGRLLKVMEGGFNRSLGVTCTHCHNPARWDSDEKPEKQVTRDMSAMMRTINGDLLKKIPNLESKEPHVSCATCHRGQVKPAVSLDEPRGGEKK